MKKESRAFEGRSFIEALSHVLDPQSHLANGRLLAWGRWGHPEFELSAIPPSRWQDSSFKKGIMPRADAICEGQPVFDLRIFPALEAPNVVEQLGHTPLNDVFNRFVIGCPEVQYLALFAVKHLPGLRKVYYSAEGRGVRFWPLHPDEFLVTIVQLQADKEGYINFPECIAAENVLLARYRAMLRILRSRLLVGVGDPVRNTDPQEILSSIWGTPGYYLDARTGNVLYDAGRKGTASVTGEDYELRWRAVLLRPTDAVAPAAESSDGKSDRRRDKLQRRFDCCFEYLSELMKASPYNKPKSKFMIKRDAQLVCGKNLGRDTFRNAWRKALKEVPEAKPVWSKAGARPKKS